MTSSLLKILALTTMIIDHVGAIFFPSATWIRVIGRVSFPLFAFLLVQGFLKTRNRGNYGLRLAIFAVVSELPYDLLFYQTPFEPWKQNILLELLCGLIMLQFLESGIKRKQSLFFLGVPLMMAAAVLCGSSYGLYGMALMLAFYLLRDFRFGAPLALAVFTWVFYGMMNFSIAPGGHEMWLLQKNSVQMFAIAAGIFLALYNGKKGKHPMKGLFYLAYPGHLALFCLIRYFLMG